MTATRLAMYFYLTVSSFILDCFCDLKDKRKSILITGVVIIGFGLYFVFSLNRWNIVPYEIR